MKNFTLGLKKYYIRYLVTAAVCLVVAGGIFCLLYFLGSRSSVALIDGLTVGGAVVLGSGAFVWLTKVGFFDFVSYGFKQVGSSLFNRHNPNKYNDFYEYKKAKSSIRETSPDYWFPMVIVGSLVLIAGIILCIIWEFNY